MNLPPALPETPLSLQSFGNGINVAVIGAGGGIGSALAEDLQQCGAVAQVFRCSRSAAASTGSGHTNVALDIEHEESIASAAAQIAAASGKLHLVIMATGILHRRDGLQPEKTWRSLSAAAMEDAFRINSIGPALVAKHFLPLLAQQQKSAFAALSARVGSIEDNRLGGWYAYRASKAALNMLIKTLAIELARRNPQALCVGLHPGTVDTGLSRPFQAGVPAEKLFAPARAARQLLQVLDQLQPAQSGRTYAWDGTAVPF